MNPSSPRIPLSALFLAVAALAGCGGGDSDPPPAPAPAPAPAPIAQTVNFTSPGNQTLGTTAPALSATATSALAVTFTSTTGSVCTVAGAALTLVAAGTCTIEANQAGGTYGGTTYSAAPPVSVSFTLAPASGNTGTCTTAPCIGFEGATVGLEGFGNLGSAAVADDPVNAANKVGVIVKNVSSEQWGGATIYTTAADKSVAPIDLTSTKTITLRVYAPAAGQVIMLKVENSVDGNKFMEAKATTTVASAWETLTFDYTTPTNGAFDAAAVYNKVSVFPMFLQTLAADSTYYFDELKYTASSVTPPPPAPPAVTFSNGYTSTNTTGQGGVWGYFSGDFTNYANTYTGGSFMNSGTPPASADSASFYLAITTSAATTAGYMGMYVTYATGGLSISGKTNLLIDLGMDEFMFQQASNKDFKVTIEGVGTGGCNPTVNRMVTPTSKDLTTYTLALNTFTTVSQNCGNAGLTAADVLALPVNAVNSQLDFPNANTTVINGGAYGTGLARGKTAFQ